MLVKPADSYRSSDWDCGKSVHNCSSVCRIHSELVSKSNQDFQETCQEQPNCWFPCRAQGVLIRQGEIYEKQGTVGDGGSRLRGLRAWVERLSVQQLCDYDPRPRDPHCAGRLCPGTGLRTNGEMARGLIKTPKSRLDSVWMNGWITAQSCNEMKGHRWSHLNLFFYKCTVRI